MPRKITTRHKILQSIIVFLNSDKKHYSILYKKFRLDFLKDIEPSFGNKNDKQFMVRDIDLTNISNEELIIFSMRSIVYDLLNNSDDFASIMLEGQLKNQYDKLKKCNLFTHLQIANDNDQLQNAINYLMGNKDFSSFIRGYGKSLLINITKDIERISQVSVLSLL